MSCLLLPPAALRRDMDGTSTGQVPRRALHYEVGTGGDLITLRLRRDGRELAFATDRASAVTLAADLLRAVDHLPEPSGRRAGPRP